MSNALIFMQSAPSPSRELSMQQIKMAASALFVTPIIFSKASNIVNKSLKWMEKLHVAMRAKISRSQLLPPKSLLLLLLRKGLHVLQ
jgi:hypothetical protein